MDSTSIPKDDVPGRLTAITGSIGRARKAIPVHTCNVCKPPKIFTRAEHLQRHQLCHEIPAFPCTFPGCDKAFHRLDLITRHMQRHEHDGDLVVSRSTRHNVAVTPWNLASHNIPSIPYGPISVTPKFSDEYREMALDFVDSDSGYASSKRTLAMSVATGYVSPALDWPLPSSFMPPYSEIGDEGSATFNSPFDHEVYIPEFAKALGTILSQNLALKKIQGCLAVIPDLIETFVIRLGLDGTSKLPYGLIETLPLHRIRIASIVTNVITSIRSKDNEKDQVRLGNGTPIAKKPTLDQSNDEVDTSHDFQDLDTIILQSPAYQWLMNSISKQAELEIQGTEDARTKIQQQILRSCLDGSIPVDWRQVPTRHRITFRAPWIIRFFKAQNYDIPPHEALDQILILVGTVRQAWASTCLQYVQLVWPDIGTQVLDLHKSLLRKDSQYSCNCTLFDQTQLCATVSPDETDYTVIINGAAASIVEVIGLLIWLSTSLSSLVTSEGVVCQYPSCEVYTQAVVPFEDDFRICWPTCADIEVIHMPAASASAGQCWTNMFHSPVLVRGYPIPRRQDRDSGLEISLGMMTQLANTNKVTCFSGHILIKGFSTIIVPTRQDEEFVFWHVVFNEDGDHISYTDTRVKELLKQYPKNLGINDLETSRHILGWCANVTNHTGAHDANYAIGWSRLKQPTTGCAFEKVTIVGGMFVTGGVSAAVGKKDKAVHIKSRDDYTMRLKWIAKKFVVLYDVQERRAWLVDGASALLHLVRASLRHDLNDPFKSLCLYDESALHEALPSYTGKEASINVLMNRENMSIPLYAKPDSSREETSVNESGARATILSNTKTNYCLKDRIESICDVLEQIMAHQADVSTEDGVGFKIRYSTRRQLEGFDFMDVATDEDPLWPRVTTLQASGRGWVDFTRAIHAITLFGTGFGDLIKPAQEGAKECISCHADVQLRKGQDYLAVCVSELQDILQKRGSENTNPWRLVDDIYWHNPDMLFEPCKCSKLVKHERTQVLLPATFPKFWGKGLKSPSSYSLQSSPRGAVLFGHSWRFPLKWKDRGIPEEGHPDQELEEMENQFHDSGIESSSGSSSVGAADSDSSGSPNPDPSTEQRARPWELPPIEDILRVKRRKLLSSPSSLNISPTPGTDLRVASEERGETSDESHLGSFTFSLPGKWKRGRAD